MVFYDYFYCISPRVRVAELGIVINGMEQNGREKWENRIEYNRIAFKEIGNIQF